MFFFRSMWIYLDPDIDMFHIKLGTNGYTMFLFFQVLFKESMAVPI